jgi:protocatechuate 3,4-dioxygenase beta subunit
MSLLIALGLAGALVRSAVAPQSAAVSGRVLEDGSRMPIAGVQVTLIPSRSGPVSDRLADMPRIAITDHDGRYEFDDVEAGAYRIAVHKAGFALPNGPGVPVVDLKAGERRDDVNVTLYKGAVIVGRVIDEAGEPLAEVRVVAMRKPAAPPSAPTAIQRERLIPAGRDGQTNDLGEFRLFSLPPGEYYVQAMPRSDFGGSSARATTLLPTYFPGTPDPVAAQSISVGAGQTSGDVVIRVISVPAFHVAGVVLDEAGRPVVNAMVRLLLDEPGGRPMVMMGRLSQSRTDTSGKFTLNNVTSGTYTLLAAAPVVISRPATAAGGGIGANGVTWFGIGGGVNSGTVGAGVMTETSNGTTIQYRDDTATRVPIVVNQSNVSGVEVIVRRPAR